MPTRLKPETAFLVLALVFGACFLVLNPPFQVPDETFHFLRGYQVSTGGWFETVEDGQKGVRAPESLGAFASAFHHLAFKPSQKVDRQDILKFRQLPLQAGRDIFFPDLTPLPHPALPYLPQAFALAIGRVLDVSPLYLLYLGRLANLLVWTLLTYWAIRAAPIYPWLLTLLALTPMSLHQAASLSPDAFTNAAAFLFFSVLLRLVFEAESSVNIKRLIPAAILSLLLTLSKLVYGMHALLFLLIPRKNFSSRREYWLGIAGVLALNFLALVWILKIGGVFPEADADRKTQFLIQEPLRFLAMFFQTAWVLGPHYLEQFIGKLGHLDTRLPFVLILYYWALLVGVACLEKGPGSVLDWGAKLFLIFCLGLESGALLTGLFLTWPQWGDLIRGGQGRYFIPMGPFFFLLFYFPAKLDPSKLQRFIPSIAVYSVMMTLTISLIYLLRRFYSGF